MWDQDTLDGCINFKVIVPIYKDKTVIKIIDGVKTNVVTRVLTKELRLETCMRIDGITKVDQYITSKNTISKTRSLIYDRYTNKYYTVDHPKDKILAALKTKPTNKIGFK